MVCNPNDNSVNPPLLGPPPAVPGFGIPFAVPKLPFPDVQIPDGIPEDILNLIDSLIARLPGGITLKPNADDLMKDVWRAIADLLSQIAPFLSLYRFFQALLNMVLCIIDVLCSLMNPFKVRRAVKRLFKKCIPDFLNLFPWLALLIMILSLLLLLLALIQYIIDTILAYIEDIIRNLQIMAQAVQLDDSDAIIEAAIKISYILCLIEQIFAILIALITIFQIIQDLLSLRGRSVCSKGPSRRGDDSECCTEDVCPSFISEQEDGFFGEHGQLKYMRTRVDATFTSFVIREETYQFFDGYEVFNNADAFPFSDIITPIDGNIFWPDSLTFDGLSNLRKVPYILDMKLTVDPSVFGHSDGYGARPFLIQNVYVQQRPYVGVYQYNGALAAPTTGTLRLIGGAVYEEDGTPYYVNGSHASMNTFIKQDVLAGVATFDDSFNFFDISYNLRINFDALFGYQLITAMCIPELATESVVFNSTITTISSINEQIGPLPDIAGALTCLTAALAKYRQDVSIESSAQFQADVEACLGSLKSETEDSFTDTVTAGTSIFESTVSITPNVQFVDLPILVSVQLRDANGALLSSSIPANLRQRFEDLISAQVTVGEIGLFEYDGYESFVAEIRTDTPGVGELTVTFNEESFSEVLNRENEDIETVLQERVIDYRFVGNVFGQGGADGYSLPGYDDPAKRRRDEGDVSRS